MDRPLSSRASSHASIQLGGPSVIPHPRSSAHGDSGGRTVALAVGRKFSSWLTSAVIFATTVFALLDLYLLASHAHH